MINVCRGACHGECWMGKVCAHDCGVYGECWLSKRFHSVARRPNDTGSQIKYIANLICVEANCCCCRWKVPDAVCFWAFGAPWKAEIAQRIGIKIVFTLLTFRVHSRSISIDNRVTYLLIYWPINETVRCEISPLAVWPSRSRWWSYRRLWRYKENDSKRLSDSIIGIRYTTATIYHLPSICSMLVYNHRIRL